MLAQLMPLTPMIDQVPVPVGVAPLTGPATVAVKVKVEPSAAFCVEVVTVTTGALCAIAKLYGVVKVLAK